MRQPRPFEPANMDADVARLVRSTATTVFNAENGLGRRSGQQVRHARPFSLDKTDASVARFARSTAASVYESKNGLGSRSGKRMRHPRPFSAEKRRDRLSVPIDGLSTVFAFCGSHPVNNSKVQTHVPTTSPHILSRSAAPATVHRLKLIRCTQNGSFYLRCLLRVSCLSKIRQVAPDRVGPPSERKAVPCHEMSITNSTTFL